jgi:hypothetical protein
VRTFQQFRDKLADVVLVAINRRAHDRIHIGPRDSCPLGCLPGQPPRPQDVGDAARAWDILSPDAYDFVSAFDGAARNESAYSKLGSAYRERFVKRGVRAGSHNAAERKAQAKCPGHNVSVAYTEI